MSFKPVDFLSAAPPRPDAARLWVAYSGGLDSTVLLHALSHAGLEGICAIHIHHGLQAAADGWAAHCAAFCSTLGVPLQVDRVRIDPVDAAGPEAAARAARRVAWRRHLQPGDVLALAHHRDDQAETVLLRLLRGSGVAGLSAMRPIEAFGLGRLWRPLLDQPRSALRDYAQQHALGWIDDPHNTDPRYARSWLRAEIMPRLRSRYPSADAALARAAAHAAEAQLLLDEVAAEDLTEIDPDGPLSLDLLAALSPPRRRNALRAWLAHGGLPPDTELLQRVERELIDARHDAQPSVKLGTETLHRYRGQLYRLPALAEPPAPALRLNWSDASPPPLPADCGELQASGPPPWPLQLGFAAGGERLRSAVSGRTRSLKNLWQEAGVPPWVRARTPLLFRDGQLVAVAGRWHTPAFAAACQTAGWDYVWTASAALR